MSDVCKPILGAPGYVTKIFQFELILSSRLRDRLRDQGFLNQYISIITAIVEKCFVVFEHTINRLSFGYVPLPQLEYYFSCFASFFLLFSFSYYAI